MDDLDEVRRRAAEVLRAAAMDRREAQRVSQERSSALSRVVLAAVESLEALTEALDGLAEEMPAAVREVVTASSRAAWERLEAAGVQRDGAAGEPVDLGRHRVLKTVARAGQPAGVVVSVVVPGVTFEGTRIRDAAVWVAGE